MEENSSQTLFGAFMIKKGNYFNRMRSCRNYK